MYSYSFALQYHRFSAFCPAPVLRRRLWAPLKNLNDTLECSSSVAVCGPHLPHHLYQGLEDWFPRTNLAYFQGLIPWKPEDAASFAPKVFLPATGGHSAWLQIRMARSACECWSQKKATIESTWAASKCEESLVGICWNPGNHPGNYVEITRYLCPDVFYIFELWSTCFSWD